MNRNSEFTIIHTSDLHFGHGNAYNRSDQRMIIEELINDAALVKQMIGKPDIITITGDIAFSANSAEEYPLARTWIRRFSRELNIDDSSFYIVPGNHDVDRKQLTAGLDSKLLKNYLRQNPYELEEVLSDENSFKTLWRKFENYSQFVSNYGPSSQAMKNLSWAQHISSAIGPITIVGLNTSLLSFDNNDSMSLT